MIYEYFYAGFQYEIRFDAAGKPESAKPLPGQPAAAYRERHVRAAFDAYLADTGRFDLVRNAVNAARTARVTGYLKEHPTVSVKMTSGRWTPPVDPPDTSVTHWRPAANFFHQASAAVKMARGLPKVGDYYGECPSCGSPMNVIERIPPDEVMIQCESAGCGAKEKHR